MRGGKREKSGEGEPGASIWLARSGPGVLIVGRVAEGSGIVRIYEIDLRGTGAPGVSGRRWDRKIGQATGAGEGAGQR